jgi:hypothetical protein
VLLSASALNNTAIIYARGKYHKFQRQGIV